jgi:hypothetical protein
MGYSVHFKNASLRQIFTLKARKYTSECHDKVCEVIRAETPKVALARVTGRPETWNITSELTDSVKDKIMKLPFVDKIQTDDETREENDRPKSVKGQIRDLVQRVIYGA